MIQRIQTVYLFLSGLAMSFLLFYPIISIESVTQFNELRLGGIVDKISGEVILSTWPVMALALLIILISLINIFLYKKRVLQMRLSVYIILLIIGFAAVVALYGKQGADMLAGQIKMEYFSIMPLVAIVFNLLAWRGIRKDYLMLKAVERIR